MTNAERQCRYRERRAAGEPLLTVVRPKGPPAATAAVG